MSELTKTSIQLNKTSELPTNSRVELQALAGKSFPLSTGAMGRNFNARLRCSVQSENLRSTQVAAEVIKLLWQLVH